MNIKKIKEKKINKEATKKRQAEPHNSFLKVVVVFRGRSMNTRKNKTVREERRRMRYGISHRKRKRFKTIPLFFIQERGEHARARSTKKKDAWQAARTGRSRRNRSGQFLSQCSGFVLRKKNRKEGDKEGRLTEERRRREMAPFLFISPSLYFLCLCLFRISLLLEVLCTNICCWIECSSRSVSLSSSLLLLHLPFRVSFLSFSFPSFALSLCFVFSSSPFLSLCLFRSLRGSVHDIRYRMECSWRPHWNGVHSSATQTAWIRKQTHRSVALDLCCS